MFISETLAEEARLDTIQQNLDLENKWVVLRVGHGGGLVLFWKASVNLVVSNSSKYYNDTWIDKGSANEWRFIGFYGELNTSRRGEAWDSLRNLINHLDIPWLCAGDLSEMVKQEEKLRGATRN